MPTLTAPRSTDRRRLGRRELLVLAAPPVLMVVTYPIFLAADAIFGVAVGGHLAWFVGMSFYWLTWGGAFAVAILGWKRTRELIRPRPFDRTMAGHVAFVVLMSALIRYLVPGLEYELATTAAVALLVTSTFANGLFEELLWRGVYLDVFATKPWLRVLWPSVWFGLWHLVPGSIGVDGPHIAMVIGPFFMGLYLAYLAGRSNTIWWTMLAHVIGGLVMIS